MDFSTLFALPERTTRERLADYGFSPSMMQRFLTPFLGGIFLERELATSSRMLDFVIRMMSEGDVAIPARGMGAIAEQMAARLPEGTIRTSTAVRAAMSWQVELENGETIPAKAVIVATDGETAARLTRRIPAPAWRSVTCMYFAADRAPFDEPILALDGEGTGPVNHLCVPSNVAPGYAPPGAALISASVLGEPGDEATLERDTRAQLTSWFGADVARWKKLGTYRIPRAKPAQGPGAMPATAHSVHLGELFICGDHRDTASIHGALSSGRRAAEAALAKLASRPALV
jgi:phytoene dehydrogenase-like protein